MATADAVIEADLSASEREELSRLDDFRLRLTELRDRGLLVAGAWETVTAEGEARRDSIVRQGRYRAAVSRAKSLSASRRLGEAREWAARARAILPEARPSWDLEIDLCWSLERDDEAIALCAEAAERFPELEARYDQLCLARTAREQERERNAERAREDRHVADLTESSRLACKDSRDDEAIGQAREILSLRPENVDGLAIAAFCLQRRGELDEALGYYETLARVEPENLTWAKWAREIRHRRAARKLIGPEGSAKVATPVHESVNAAPTPISWSSVAGEFLQEHWQKLILCLAVLLIVVSSTIGAHVLLGDRLWSPVGKCSLAMVGTLMFAALGMGLVGWGAERAGRMMLVTTLIVVPIHFMLVGELRIVLEPTPLRLAGFAVLTGSLVVVSRVISGMLVPSRDAWFLTVPLLLMSVFNATLARGVEGPWARQFAAFQAPAIVAMAAVWALRWRNWEPSAERNREFSALFLGLLGFALVTGVIRTGVYALGLPATLFAVPVMLAAISCVHGARWLSAFEADGRRVALIRMGGYCLAGLAFALALARPLAPSPLLSGNTLATALLGLGLFGESLWRDRQPAFLYLVFAAFVLAYLTTRQALGLEPRFHGPYRALNGLVLNPILAVLALIFSGRWKDERLARHCHYLGIPFSIAACLYSGFEPRAAVLCLSGYVLLYLVATWIFRAPRVQYLALAALSGAAYFGLALVPGFTLGQQALAAAAIGLLSTCVALAMRWPDLHESYRAPWRIGGLVLLALGIVGATAAMVLAGSVSFVAAATFLVVAVAASLATFDRPRRELGFLTVICADVAAGLGLVAADLQWRWALGFDHYAIAAGASGLIQLGLGAWLERPTSMPVAGGPRRSFVLPLRHLGLGVAVLSAGLCGGAIVRPIGPLGPEQFVRMAVALGLNAISFAVGSTIVGGAEALGYLAAWSAVAGYFFAVLGGLRVARVPRVGATMQVAVGAASLLLLTAWDRLRVPCYRRPLCLTALGLAVVVVPVALATWHPDLHIALALSLSGVALAMLCGEFPLGVLVHGSLVAFLGLWMKGLGAAGLATPTGTLYFGVAATSYGLALLGIAEALGTSVSFQSSTRGLRPQMFRARIPSFVIVASILADATAWIDLGRAWWPGLILLLAGSSLLWASRFLRDMVLVHLGLWNLAGGVVELACHGLVGGELGLLLGWLAITLVLMALAYALAGALARHWGISKTYGSPCLDTALAFAAVVLVLAPASRIASRSAFVPAASALAVDAAVILLVGALRRWTVLTYPAVAAVVAASYVVLLSVGEPDPANAYVLGLNAVSQALLLWPIGELCRRARGAWVRTCATPLFRSAVVLTCLAIVPAHASPVTMTLVAVSFLLAIKGLPSTGWIYPAAAAVGLAVGELWLFHLSRPGLLAASVAGAYLLWAIGTALRLRGHVLRTRLGLEDLDYGSPCFNLAVALGMTAFALKFDRLPERGLDLSAHPWVPLALAPLALGLLRAYPRGVAVHVCLMLLSWGIISLIAPSLAVPGFVALALLVASFGFQAMRPVIRSNGEMIDRLVRLRLSEVSSVLRGWERITGTLGGAIACGLVFSGVVESLLGMSLDGIEVLPSEWWAVLAAILLVGLKLGLAPLNTTPQGWAGPEEFLIAAELTGLALLWWLGVSGAPPGRWLPATGIYYPIATATALLGIVDQNRRLSSPRMAALTSPLVLLLALVSIAMTLGRENPTTAVTLALAAMASIGWSIGRADRRAAGLGGLAWLGAGALSGSIVAGRYAPGGAGEGAIGATLGILLAIYLLWAIAGRLRRRMSPDRTASPAEILEGVGFLGALLASGLVALATSRGVPTAWAGLTGVGSMLIVALYFVLLVPRWREAWLVYLAQAALVGAYVVLRVAHPLPAASDAAIMTLFAFIDMGIAEVLVRLRLPEYARPTLITSMVLPVLPLVQIVGMRGVGEVTVFQLVSAATFYAVACGTLGRKTLAYAAGVLYNAALWVLWGQLGWQLADHPQFFLVPVGLSAILFAEANRRELGREAVNAIRTAGLIVTYLAMAAPIWQYRSFGDWLALLVGSLAGLFVGIGLRVQTFVWLGLATFVSVVLYELGRVSVDHALAKWAIMLTLGIVLVFFVALNEKKQIVGTMRGYLAEVRSWE